MRLLHTDTITPTKHRVYSIHFMPSTLTEEDLSKGILVEDYPEPAIIPYKTAIMYINPVTKEVWYEYTDRPLTADEEIANLKAQLTEQEARARNKEADDMAFQDFIIKEILGGM